MHARFVALMLGALIMGAIAMPATGALPATGAGSLDPTFGIDGQTSLNVLVGSNRDGIGSGVVQPDGKLAASGYVQRAGGNDLSILAARFLDNGAPDPAFGTGGTAVYAIDESAYADWFGPALGADGRIFVVGAAKSGGVYRCIVLALQPPETNPATGMRWGPNSHFYTIEAAECAAVKLDPGWRFESYDFNAWPMPGGGCPTGTVAVKRVYNNRFAQNDSNHRYMTDETIYQEMLGRGWSGEGVVMCAVAGGGPG